MHDSVEASQRRKRASAARNNLEYRSRTGCRAIIQNWGHRQTVEGPKGVVLVEYTRARLRPRMCASWMPAEGTPLIVGPLVLVVGGPRGHAR